MKEVKLLDVTLRDGGCVNNFEFGTTYMNKILASQEEAGIDYIELGYIDEIKGSELGRTQYINEVSIIKSILHEKKKSISYLAMIDYGRYDIDNLEYRNDFGIDGIRYAFHKEHYVEAISDCRKIIDKGYELFIQPMLTCRYNESELLDLISLVNSLIPDASAFYIVDSFGEMHPEDVIMILNTVEHNLTDGMPIGFHSHNNLQLSYSNSRAFLEFDTQRSLFIDSSIMGMGKGAGNLNTELIVDYLNMFFGKNYLISPIVSIIDEVINQIRSEYYWGYSVEYYLSSINHCSPTYAKHFYNKHMLPINMVEDLLKLLPEEKKISFDEQYAEELYRKYNERNAISDTKALEYLNAVFSGKKILLVAPGKSVISAKDKITSLLKNDYISIGLNMSLDIELDYYITTRKEVFDKFLGQNKKIIVLSNIIDEARDNVFILDYLKWIDIDGETHDSSSVVAFNLLKKCGVSEILLAGFDGFSVNINENYFDPNMRHPVSVQQQEKQNLYYKKLIDNVRRMNIKIDFLTPSKYDE